MARLSAVSPYNLLKRLWAIHLVTGYVKRLIMDIVTTSFVKESGIRVSTPQADSATRQENANIFIAITAEGEVWVDRRPVDPRSLRAIVARLHADNPEGSVIIQSDEHASTRMLVEVMDQVRLAGVEGIAIAADKVDE